MAKLKRQEVANKKLAFERVLGSITLEQMISQSIPLEKIVIDDIEIGDVLFQIPDTEHIEEHYISHKRYDEKKVGDSVFIIFGHITPPHEDYVFLDYQASRRGPRIHYDLFEGFVGLTKPIVEKIEVRHLNFSYPFSGLKGEPNWRLWKPPKMEIFINWPNENPLEVKG